jgi:hypothetical protein
MPPTGRALNLAEWAVLAAQAGRPNEAVSLAHRASEILAKAPPSVDSAIVRDDIAIALNQSGHANEAFAIHREVATELENALGPTHQDAILAKMNAAGDLGGLNRWGDAYELLLPTEQTSERALGPDTTLTGDLLEALADTEDHTNREQAALEHARRALAVYEQHSLGGFNLVMVLTTLGRAEKALGRPEARSTLERAISVGTAAKLGPMQLADARFSLAQALPSSDGARAVRLAQEARDAWAAALARGDASAGEPKKAVDAWLAMNERRLQ